MATFTLGSNIKAGLWDYWGEQSAGATLSGTSTKVTAKLDDPVSGEVYSIVYTGNGLKIDDNGFAAGTVTKIQVFGAKSVLFATVSGVSLKAPLLNTDIWNFHNEIFKGNDTFKGSNKADELEPGAGNDIVTANGGDDIIIDGIGSDKYDGGAGYDEVSYGETFWVRWLPATGITADLKAGTVSDPWGGKDTLKNIEAIRGTHYVDKLSGSDTTTATESFAGLAGNDVIDGRGGTDMLQYGRDYDYGARSGIKADLTKGKVVDGFGDVDTVKNVENVSGTIFADAINGDGKANYFYSDRGSDVLRGLAGNDTLQGGEGNDKLYGGTGGDKFIFTSTAGAGDGNDVIYDWDDNSDDIVFNNGGGEVTRFSDLEIVQVGADTVIRYDNSSIKLVGVDKADITSSDFLF